jgi:hypothetical protein
VTLKQIHAGPDNQSILAYDDLFDPGDWEIEDRAGVRKFFGRLIGMGTSQREEHSHAIAVGRINAEPGDDARDRNQRCTACRWSEIYIFECLTADATNPLRGRYCVYTLGPSTIRGEVTRSNVRWGTSGFEVMEMATVRRGDRGPAFLPAAHARALSMAAAVDSDIADAYVNRAVA